MRREFRRWSGWAALLAALLAAAATCSTALAQAPIQPAGQPPTTQPPAGMNAEQQRVVDAVHGVGCIPLEQASNSMAPPRLFGGVVQCLALGDYDQAARLFALAGIYMHFDVARVSDRTSADVAGALPMLATSGASDGQKEGFEQGLHKLENDPAQLQAVCNEVARIGMPSYYPTYMIAGGMGAFLGEPKGGPLVQNFDAAGTWNKLQATYLQCPSALGIGQKIKNLLATAPDAHTNDVAQKIAELPDPELGFNYYPLEFSPDGSLLASRDATKINLWDWKNHHLLRRLDPQDNSYIARQPFVFSPDGRFFAVCTMARNPPRTVRVWNTSTWEVAQDIVDSTANGCSAVAFSADSRMLLRVDQYAANDLDDLIAYSTETWQKLWGLHDKRIDAQTLAVSPKGNLVAVGGYHNVPWPGQVLGKYVPEVALLDLQQRKYVRIINPESVVAVSWNPDGTRLAVLGNTEFEIYDVSTGQRLVRQSLPYGAPPSIRYSPNGKYLVINSFIGAYGPKPGFGMQIWDGKASALLQTNSDDTAGIAFSPDSRYLAVAKRGRIEIWQFKPTGSGDSTQR